jgi:RNA polymerase-binding transcription factor
MDPDRARELLGAERQRIERALSGVERQDDSEPADEYDPANLAADLYQDEFDEGLEADLRDQLAAVERAEQRMAAGTYGVSVESGERIPDERLEAFPTAERTAAEQERLERSGL